MQTLDHAIVRAQPKGMTRNRATGLIFTGLLQTTLIWALVEGLNIKVPIIKFVPGSGRVIETKIPPQPLPPPSQPHKWYNPIPLDPNAPRIDIKEGPDEGGGFYNPPQPTNVQPPQSIASTHTTPPYPMIAIRLAEEGVVRLRLSISPQGAVSEAAILRSSGYDNLDQAARDWILAHWRYRPATRGDAAVASTTEVQVNFNLKNAR